MNILITGSKGFIGKNLVVSLQNIKDGKLKNSPLSSDINLLEFNIDSEQNLLDEFCKIADVVVHLAGINRPLNPEEFMQGNFSFTEQVLKTLKKYDSKASFIITSSIQADLDNLYGLSKKAAENLIMEYSKNNNVDVMIYRLPNVFGKWCKPNYNSVVATFCYNIANNLPITINNTRTELTLVYIDDVVDELINAIAKKPNRVDEFCEVDKTHNASLGYIADLLYSFKNIRLDLSLPNVGDEFINKLYATYLSYLPSKSFSYPLKMNVDSRGSFTEIIRTQNAGQFSVNISKAGITKGNHWHHTKNEKFLVVSGKGVIRFRDMKNQNSEIIEYFVCGDKLEVVDIPTGYTHNIENLGDSDMVTFMWSNECFNPDKPDTYFEEV